MGSFGRDGVELSTMVSNKSKYQKLPGKSIFPFDARTLWQGKDHLLYVESVFFKECYKRFYYNDIQSIVLQRTRVHLIWSFVWGALALLLGIYALVISGPPYVSGALFTIFLVGWVVNYIMGPSCTVYLQTAVQIQKISSLRRFKTADKVLTHIKFLVEEIQGVWEESNNTQSVRTAPAGSQFRIGRLTKVQQNSTETYRALLHQILFSAVTILGLLGAFQFFFKSQPVVFFKTLLHSGIQIMVIIALARWHQYLKGTLLAKLNWLTLGFIFVQSMIGYGLFMVVSFRNPEMNYNHWAMFQLMLELQMSDHLLALLANIIHAGGSLLLGTLGLILTRQINT